jgi:hypothetical protein
MDPGAMIDAWRERGEQRLDPVRFRFIEALARRATTHHGDARRILDGKLAKLLVAYGEDLEKARRAEGPPAPHAADARQTAQAPRGPLAELVDDVTRHASPHGDGRAASDLVHSLACAPELKTLSYFRSTWSRLSADRRLTQSLAKMPKNAGPLNSHHLVHRSLTLMRDLSPAYLNRFMSYIDALLWLDQVNGGSTSAGTDVPRAEGNRKTARGRSGSESGR